MIGERETEVATEPARSQTINFTTATLATGRIVR